MRDRNLLIYTWRDHPDCPDSWNEEEDEEEEDDDESDSARM